MADGSKALQRLAKERTKCWPKIKGGHCEQPDPEDNFKWDLWVYGPENYTVDGETRPCPYAGKMFKVKLTFPARYPFEGPTMLFETGQLYHPNVSQEDGNLCMEGIEAADLTVDKRAKHVINLLATPNVGNPQDADCAKLMTENITEYEAKAKAMASKAPDAPSA